MPYATDHIGIYKIFNKVTNSCYVGQSRRVKKRVNNHFCDLRKGTHPNPRFQAAFNAYGEEAFDWSLEIKCDSTDELDMIEELFLSGEAKFLEENLYNISDFAKTPMRNKTHSEEVRKKISAGRRASTFNFQSSEYRKTLSAAQKQRFFSKPEFVARVKFIVDNQDMSYAGRGRVLGMDTSSVRKLALKYAYLKGVL
jgi:group I intron endonuclease